MGGGISRSKKASKEKVCDPISNSDASGRNQTRPIAVDVTEVPAQTSLNIVVPKAPPLVPIVTPRQEENLLAFVPNTPSCDEMKCYRYFCPICMNYFKNILKSACCSNYICLPCCKSYLLSKGLEADSINVIIGNSYIRSIDCPNCACSGFDPRLVSATDEVRDYRTSLTESSSNHDKSSDALPMHSPLKVGDTFDDLKRKMKKFQTNLSPCDASAAPENNGDDDTLECSMDSFVSSANRILFDEQIPNTHTSFDVRNYVDSMLDRTVIDLSNRVAIVA